MEPSFDDVFDGVNDICKIYENLTSTILEYGYEFIRRERLYGSITGIKEVLDTLDMLDSVLENSKQKAEEQHSHAAQAPTTPPPAPRPVSKQKFTIPKMFKTTPRMFFSEPKKRPVEVEEVQKDAVDMKQKFEVLNEMLRDLAKTVGTWNASPDELVYDDGTFSPWNVTPRQPKPAPVQAPQPRRSPRPRTFKVDGIEIDPNKRIEVLKLKKALTSAIENRVVNQLKDMKNGQGDKENKLVNVDELNLRLN